MEDRRNKDKWNKNVALSQRKEKFIGHMASASSQENGKGGGKDESEY